MTAGDEADRAETPTGEPAAENTLLVMRPPFQLRSLSPEHRWEATRRHPYYQLAWRLAQAYHRQEPAASSADVLLRQAALVHLAAIGVSGAPPDPATEYSQLVDANLNPAWLTGAVHPITFRGLAALLLAALPPETLGQLGLLMIEASIDPATDRPPPKAEAMFKLQSLDFSGLNSYPDEPFVSINPAAAARQISQALNQLLKQWKQERGLTEQRERADKISQYLAVWDEREGWEGGTYIRSSERTLKQIAARRRKSLPSISNHYRSAFELLTGHPYSPETWLRVFGVLKLSDLLGSEPGPVSKRRPLKSPSSQLVPESRLGDESARRASRTTAAGDDADLHELLLDLSELFAGGKSDEQIVVAYPALPLEAVRYLRERGCELR